ncbi:autotransporter outer membrane beta-barrel domain-containing protein [Pseudomonas sp. TWP3-2]|uniref:autotransporter outer membrane beta-barrel domain-containing protein n=1 Tax=Pseudomonas sp. TWP3-2 TaxID=2804574 RepID=UPI003CF7999C
MLARHTYRLHQLAVAITLTLGYAGISLAQETALEPEMPAGQVPVQLRSAFDTVINDPDKVPHEIKNATKVVDGFLLKAGEANDLISVKSRASYSGVIDGGGGGNLIQLDGPKGGKLGESHNFLGLEVKQGEWTRKGPADFTGGVLVHSKAQLTNEGTILGDAVTEGILINKGMIERGVIVQSGGDLTHSGNIAGTVDVHENGHFAGNGEVSGLNIQGRFSVDEVYGAPRVKGDLTLASSAVLAYSVDAAGDSPTIIVDGTAVLGDATLRLVSAGDYPQSSQHTILVAGNVEGRFGTVENNLAYMTPTLDYDDPKRVGLSYTRNDVRLEEAATTENASAVAESIEAPPAPPQQLADTQENPPRAKNPAPPVTAQTPEQNQPGKTVQALQPPSSKAPVSAIHSVSAASSAPVAPTNTAVAALLTTSKSTAAIALEQLAGSGNANLSKATLSSVAPVSASMLSAMHQLDGIHGTQKESPRHAAGKADSGRVWLQALGHGGKLDRDFEPMQHSTKGLLLGADWRVDEEWRLGLLGGTSTTSMDSHELDGNLDSWHLGAYALRQSGPVSMRLGANWGSHEGRTKRKVEFDRFSNRLKASYEASTQQAFAEMGYNLGRADTLIEPFASVGFQRYQRDGYTEKGGDAALKVHGQSQGNINSTLGLRMASVSTLNNGMRLTPRFSAGWKHVYGDTYTSTRQRLDKGGRDYTVYGAELDRDSLMLDTGLDLAVSNSHTLGVGLSGEIGTDSRNHGVTGQWRMAF